MKRVEGLSEARQQVENIVQAFCDTWNRHDMDAFAQLFAEDAEFVNVVGLWWKGREEIRRAHEKAHATMFRNSRLKMVKIMMRFVNSDVAIVRAAWELTGHLEPSGKTLPMRKGILVNLVVRVDTKWEILDTQNTDIIEGFVAPLPHK